MYRLVDILSAQTENLVRNLNFSQSETLVTRVQGIVEVYYMGEGEQCFRLSLVAQNNNIYKTSYNCLSK